MPDKTSFHRCSGKRCLRCWQNRQRHARGKKDGAVKAGETAITGFETDQLKQFELEARQTATAACARHKQLRTSIGLITGSVEKLPKWKQDAMARADQHVINCAKTCERLCRLKRETDEDVVSELLQVVEKGHEANLGEQKVPPFKSQLPLQDQKQDVEQLLKVYGTRARVISWFDGT